MTKLYSYHSIFTQQNIQNINLQLFYSHTSCVQNSIFPTLWQTQKTIHYDNEFIWKHDNKEKCQFARDTLTYFSYAIKISIWCQFIKICVNFNDKVVKIDLIESQIIWHTALHMGVTQQFQILRYTHVYLISIAL